jgi:hypothetical protein
MVAPKGRAISVWSLAISERYASEYKEVADDPETLRQWKDAMQEEKSKRSEVINMP